MANSDRIEAGDMVNVSFHGSQTTLIGRGTVLALPLGPGGSWIIRDVAGFVHYISEPCTISLLCKGEPD